MSRRGLRSRNHKRFIAIHQWHRLHVATDHYPVRHRAKLRTRSAARRLNELLRPTDLLLLSANLAPGPDYARGVEAVLPQYDNALTHDWLLTLLLDLGFERDDGKLNFAIETNGRGLRRITAHFELKRGREVRVYGETISFDMGARIRLFFSYRHTPETMRSLLGEHGIKVKGEWLNGAGEEGVFLCRKA